MKFQTRFLNSLVALVCVALVAAGCGGAATSSSTPPAVEPTTAPGAEQPTTAPASGEVTSFSYWNGFTASDRPVMEENVANFDKAHPEIEVKMDIQPWDSILPKLLPSMRSGSDPDVVSLDANLIPQYVKSDVLMPVDDLWTAEGIDPAKFSDGTIGGMTVDGKKYGAPIIYFTTLMYMNNDLFKKAGLPETCPADWDEWKNALTKLTVDENGDGTPEQYGFSWGDHAAVSIWPHLVWGGGGDFVNEDATKSMLDDPKTIAAVQEWADLINKNKIMALGLSGVEADNLFSTQKAAMTISGPWVSTGFKDAGLNFQICQIPEGPAGRFTQGSGVYFVVNKNTKAKDAVYELMKYWETDDAQINWSSKTGFAPTRADLATNPKVTENPYVKAFAESAPYARTYLPGVVEYAKVNDDIITPAILEVARGNKTAQESLTEAAAEMNEVLAEQQK